MLQWNQVKSCYAKARWFGKVWTQSGAQITDKNTHIVYVYIFAIPVDWIGLGASLWLETLPQE